MRPVLRRRRLPTAVVNQVEGNAGASNVTITPRLSAASSTAVSVAYATVNASAKAIDGDFVAKKGTLSFAPGVVSQARRR